MLPSGVEPGLQEKFVWEVPTGGKLPTADGKVQMYPCHSFEAHVVLAGVDPATGKVSLHRYVCGHDCGVMISPDVVHGMCYGGIAHGVGAALMEKFAYSDEGQLLSGSFMDYLIPSAHEVPAVTIVDHCTPSPLTTFGQKGSGEAGYLGAPAAVANAVNDALAPLDASIEALPMSPDALNNLFSLLIGFAVAGALTSAYQALAQRPAGFGLLQQGDLKNAETAFLNVMASEPGYADGPLNAAYCGVQEGLRSQFLSLSLFTHTGGRFVPASVQVVIVCWREQKDAPIE